MQMSGSSARLQIDDSVIVTRVQNIAEARALPAGTVVGDMHGGVTFSDVVARELERRSHCGWCDASGGSSDKRWTIIVLNR
jgi:hypothetical protein